MLLDFETFKVSAKGRQLVEWVKNNFNRCKSDRLQIQRQWDLNLEMYSGRQWLEYVGADPVTAKLMTPPAPRHRVRATTNLTRPLVRMEISRQSSQHPTAYVIPSTSNESSISAAQAGETIWKSVCERQDFQTRIMEDAAFWNSITGNVFIKEVWNPNKTDKSLTQQNPETGEMEPAVGDVDISVVRPYNLFVPDLLVRDIEEQPYTFEAYTKPVEWVKRFFGSMLTQPVTPDSSARGELFQSRYFGVSNNTEAVPDCVLVIECFIKPGGCEYFPEGGMVTLVGNELVQVAQAFPFSHGEYPYAHIRHIPTGKFYGDSVLVDTNPLQREYNGTRSQVMEAKRLMANPQLLVPKGSIQASKMTSQPGALIEYMPGLGEPKPLQLQALPEYVLREMDVIKADMDDISGQHAPSRGMAPGQGVTAATAIAFLQEKDDNLMSPTYSSIEAAIQKIARHTLIDVQEKWDLPRSVKTTGLDGALDAMTLKGSEITTDIKIEAGSSLPESRPARQAFLMELFEKQAIDNSMLLDLLDFGGVKKLQEQTRIDVNQARRENLKMKEMLPEQIVEYNNGKIQEAQMGTQEQGPNALPLYNTPDPATFPPMIDVHDYDNHEVHVKIHNNYRKSAEFESLDTLVKDEFNRHVRLHQAYLDSISQEMMQASMTGEAPPGGMPQPDGSSAPPPMMGQPQQGPGGGM